MRGMVALFGLAALLGLVLTWELAASEDSASPEDTASSTGRLQTVATGADKTPLGVNGDALADIAASVTERPLFSANRRPSRGATTATATQAGEDEVPRLTGVIVGPSGGWAIFAGADGKSHAAATGDVIGAFKVRAIGPGVVTLTGPEGDRVVRPTYLTAQSAGSSEVTSSDFVASRGANRDARARGGPK